MLVYKSFLYSAQLLGYSSMKEKKVEVVHSFVDGNNTFISLPSGYGKSLIYAVLLFDCYKLRSKDSV